MTPKSYRPISLMTFLLKTLEMMIDIYIRDEVLKGIPLNKRQYAHQPGESTDLSLDDLNRLLIKSIEDIHIIHNQCTHKKGSPIAGVPVN